MLTHPHVGKGVRVFSVAKLTRRPHTHPGKIDSIYLRVWINEQRMINFEINVSWNLNLALGRHINPEQANSFQAQFGEVELYFVIQDLYWLNLWFKLAKVNQ